MENQDLTLRIKEADALYTNAHMDAALKAYQAILTEDDTIAWVHSRIGAVLAQMNDLEGAERSLKRALELDPTLPQAHSNLGNIFYARGDYDSALAKYREAVALDQNNPTFHENLHAAYKKLGKLGDAVSALKQAHRLDREQAKAEAKAKMSTMKRTIGIGRGCLGSVMTIFVMLTVLIALLSKM